MSDFSLGQLLMAGGLAVFCIAATGLAIYLIASAIESRRQPCDCDVCRLMRDRQ